MLMQATRPNEVPSHLKRAIRPGRSLQDLAKELQHIEEAKQDFTVPVKALVMNENADIQFNGNKLETEHTEFKLNNWSLNQISQFADVPTAYAKRLLKESPQLLAQNINHGFMLPEKLEAGSRLVRTVDGNLRAFLSNRYRMLDSYDLMNAVLPTLIDNQFEVASCELTEQRLYLKCVTPKIEGEVKKGDMVNYGVMISTSDVGAGSLRVEPFIMRLVCLNGMVSNQSFRKAHLGRNTDIDAVYQVLSDSTKSLNDRAFFATVNDYLLNTMKPEVFHKELAKMQEASERPIKNLNLEQVVDVTMKTVKLSGETLKKGILDALADGNQEAGLTQWGLVNSFTAAAKMTTIDYDTATEVERAAGQVLDLSPSQWRYISEAKH